MKTKNAIKVNADYESVLFSGKGSDVINQSIEYLAFFLEAAPLFTSKKYSAPYLTYVESITGHLPRIVHQGKAELWWGKLQNEGVERLLNSKITSTQLMLKQGWGQDLHILKEVKDFEKLDLSKNFIIKDPFEMSGRGFTLLREYPSEDESKAWESKFQKSPLIAEPLLERRYDFSHYLFPDGHTICYQNLVDGRFQYKGTAFENWRDAKPENLPFYSEIDASEWKHFQDALLTIRLVYQQLSQGLSEEVGFSVDSFIYKQESKLKIHIMSEVNFRKTMGFICYLLAQKYAQQSPWARLLIQPSYKNQGGFEEVHKRLNHLLLHSQSESGVIILSPGDARFETFFLCARDRHEGEKLEAELNRLLTDA